MKFIPAVILLGLFLLLVSTGKSASAAISHITLQQQDTSLRVAPATRQDTSKKTIGAGSEKIEYSAQDSTKLNKKEGIVYLYGKARVIYQAFELDADYITYNSKTNTVFASGRKDPKTNKYVGKPIFKMEQQGSSVADSLFYNTKTGKGTVFNTFTEQEGGFFSGGQSKRQPDNEINVKSMTYSTCNLPHPHFGLHITKGIVTDKQIITGPVYLKIEDIPLPLGLPFAFFPKPNKKNSGVIIPSVGDDYTRGFNLQNGGYYLILNDYWDAKFLGTIFSRGSYSASVASSYKKRYKYTGNIKVDYASNRFGLEGTPAYEPRKDFSVQWAHSQDANAKPGTTFSANVNIKTSGYNTNTAGGNTYNLNAITENLLSSGISYSKNFTNGINYSLAATHSQNTLSRDVSITLPSFSMNVPTFSPFDSKKRVGEQKWYQKLTLGYSVIATNSLQAKDSVLFKPQTLNKLSNGFQHSIPVAINFTAAKYFNFTAGGTYLEKWQFQSTRQVAIKGIVDNGILQPDRTLLDTVNGFNRSGEYSFNMGVSTKIYNTAQFKNLGNLKALRWVMTPNVNMSYRPDFSAPSFGYYRNLEYQDGSPVMDPVYNRQRRYSIFQGTTYGGPAEGRSGSIGFTLDNTVEGKVLSAKDTTGSGTRKIPIIQGLTLSAQYNFLAPAFKLSDINFNGRSQFTDKLGFTYQGIFSPYATRDSSFRTSTTQNTFGRVRERIDRYTIPVLTDFGLSFGYSFNPESFKKRNENIDNANKQAQQTGMTPEQAAALREVTNDPNAFVDFNIPWNFTFDYRFSYSRQRTAFVSTISNVFTGSGDFNVTPKWKVQFTSGYDVGNKTLSPTSFSIYRDLHCWDMSIHWIPFGLYRSYNLTIKVKASILQDLKLSKQQAYSTRF